MKAHLTYSPVGSILFPTSTGQNHGTWSFTNVLHESHSQLPAFRLHSESSWSWSNTCKQQQIYKLLHACTLFFLSLQHELLSLSKSPTLNPSSQLIHRHPLVKKEPTACRATWWTQPSWRNCLMMASIHGKPVWPCNQGEMFWAFLRCQLEVLIFLWSWKSWIIY